MIFYSDLGLQLSLFPSQLKRKGLIASCCLNTLPVGRNFFIYIPPSMEMYLVRLVSQYQVVWSRVFLRPTTVWPTDKQGCSQVC